MCQPGQHVLTHTATLCQALWTPGWVQAHRERRKTHQAWKAGSPQKCRKALLTPGTPSRLLGPQRPLPPALLAPRLRLVLRPAAAPPPSHQHRGRRGPAQSLHPTRPDGHQHPRPPHGLRQHPRQATPSLPWAHKCRHRFGLNPLNGQDPPALEAPVQASLHHRPFLGTEDPRLGPADVGMMALGTTGSHQGPARLASLSWALGTKRPSWASAWCANQLGG